MRVEKRYVFDITLYAESDIGITITTLERAASEWATCSNESEPLLHLRDQLYKQALEAGL